MTHNNRPVIEKRPKSPNFEEKVVEFFKFQNSSHQMSQPLGYGPTASVYKISYKSGKPSRSYSHLNIKWPKFLRIFRRILALNVLFKLECHNRMTRHHTSQFLWYMTHNNQAIIKQSPKSPNFDEKVA